MLEDFKEYSLKTKEKLSKLFDTVSPPTWEREQDFDDFYEKFYDTVDHLQKYIQSPVYCEYFETKLLFISRYYNKRLLLRLEKLLHTLEKADYYHSPEKLYKNGVITEEELEDSIKMVKEMQENITEMIQKIKEKIGQD